MGIIVIALFQGRIVYALSKSANFMSKISKTDLEIESWLFDKEKARHNFREESFWNHELKEFGITTSSIQYYFRFHSGNDVSDSLE